MAVGELELEILKLLWQKNKVTVREVLTVLKERKVLAYTTVMTVMDNLYKKGFLTRKKTKKSYYYSPTIKESPIITNSLSQLFKTLIGNYGKTKVLYTTLSISLPTLPKTIIIYKKPVGYGASLALGFILLGFSAIDLLANLRFFGTFDYLAFLISDPSLFINKLHLFSWALLESFPIVNILTTAISFILVLVLVKKLSKLLNLRIPSFTNLGGVV